MTARAARVLAWSLCALAMVLAGASVLFLVLGRSTPPPAGTFGFRGFAALFAVVFGTVGALIASRQPSNPIGWLLLSAGVISGLQELAQQYAIYGALPPGSTLPLATIAAWGPSWLWFPATATVIIAALLFPDGRLGSARARWVLWAIVLGATIGACATALTDGPIPNFRPVDNPLGIAGAHDPLFAAGGIGLLLYFAGIVGAVVSMVGRFRRASGEERVQMKWIVAAVSSAGIVLAASTIGAAAAVALPSGEMPNALEDLVVLGFASIPIAMGVAILKYRLYDIDVVISKAVVYGALALLITAVYVAVVVGVGAAVGASGDALLSAAAAAIVALAFQPVRRWARRLANRLVYGKRSTPYEVLSGFSDRLGEAYSVDDVLPRMARVLGEAIGAERVAVWLRAANGFRPAAAWPSGEGLGEAARLPEGAVEVRHQGELLGALTTEMPASEPLAGASAKLVADLAGQAGLVLRNAALVEDLKASRQRLVVAQDEERRRIERNIHDGAQQQLVALTVQLRLLEQQIDRDPASAKVAATRLQADATTALEDLRDLARGIYPPLLADQGLGAALEAQARKSPVQVTIEADGVGRLGQDLEAAVYFCVLEALQNVSKYAGASSATVRLSDGGGALTFEVADDGRGFDPSETGYGTGLQGMADRLAAIGGELEVRSTPGGGTTVAGRLKLEGGPS